MHPGVHPRLRLEVRLDELGVPGIVLHQEDPDVGVLDHGDQRPWLEYFTTVNQNPSIDRIRSANWEKFTGFTR